jgi:hypothetical protein
LKPPGIISWSVLTRSCSKNSLHWTVNYWTFSG